MQHFSGMHSTSNFVGAMPTPFLAYYPATVSQDLLQEAVTFLDTTSSSLETLPAGHPPAYEPLGPRRNYEALSPHPLDAFGPTVRRPLGDIALARSGDKGANINVGFFVQTDEQFAWLQAFLTTARMQQLMGEDWREDFFIERVEFRRLRAVHFVIYGPLGRGVSSSSKLDSLGKGFADYVRDRHVDVPEKFMV